MHKYTLPCPMGGVTRVRCGHNTGAAGAVMHDTPTASIPGPGSRVSNTDERVLSTMRKCRSHLDTSTSMSTGRRPDAIEYAVIMMYALPSTASRPSTAPAVASKLRRRVITWNSCSTCKGKRGTKLLPTTVHGSPEVQSPTWVQ